MFTDSPVPQKTPVQASVELGASALGASFESEIGASGAAKTSG